MVRYVESLSGKPKDGLRESFLSSLPLGDVRPSEGWLLEQLRLVSEGITGRLPEYGPYFRPENNGFLYPDVTRGWEEVPLWHPSPAFIPFEDRAPCFPVHYDLSEKNADNLPWDPEKIKKKDSE